ncbi:hypothetical protein [Pseudomonas sp. Teo4]|uniref:hypothetical protein n=1 Tax=Pseudomonas sp. Teo4 TaxID=3064528 RepID=UPI002AB824D5|nr:hypothetical protein [Pseudomonas sp. Teo4]MDZ3996060.1 hypothetical protein [Pseudomonas sp. Teo4]
MLVTKFMSEVGMFSKDDLLQSFASVDEYAGCYFFQHKLPKAIYEYCLKSAGEQDLLVISENISDRDFSVAVVGQAPVFLSQNKTALFKISPNEYGFTHALVVPNTYHGSLKGRLEGKRENLYLCIPIHRCEFSGAESEGEFKEMIQRMIPVFRWDRHVCPKIKVYFDNPATETGTNEAGVLMKYPTLLSEIDNLSGVVSGFIEVTNYKGDVVEVLSASKGVFTLIRNRKDEEVLSHSKLIEALRSFVLVE